MSNNPIENQEISILLVEDDPNLGDILQEYLTLKGYKTVLCKDGLEGYEVFEYKGGFDICILDVMMPVMDGFTLAEKIREKDEQIPIIFLTAKSLKEDKVRGFKIGADDYVTKPFTMEELQLRIGAILKRCKLQLGYSQGVTEVESYDIGTYQFNHIQQILTHNNEGQKLTTKESALLKLFCQYQNQVLKREDALKQIWGEDTYFTARSMDVFITKLRKYLKKDDKVSIINVHGRGYKLVTV